jgi:hypothetical protein
MRAPIACTLTQGQALTQLAAWRELLLEMATRVDRMSPTELVFRLHDDVSRHPALIDLARREKACCQFFGLSIGIDVAFVTIRISAPADAIPMLDDFEALSHHRQ